MNPFAPALQIALALVTLAAAACDWRTRRIPNLLVLAGLIAGFVLNTVYYGTAGLALATLGLGLALLVYFPLFALRATGAGDAKLMAAVGSMVGPANWLGIFLATAVTGGVVALVVTLLRKRLAGTLSNAGFILGELLAFRAPYDSRPELQAGAENAITLPHGIVIAVACWGFLTVVNLWGPR